MISKNEKRFWPRKGCLLPAIFTVSKRRDPLQGYITDISCGGVKLLAEKDLKNYKALTIEFALLGVELSVTGAIRWREGKNMGVQFSHPVNTALEKNVFTFVNAP